MKNHKFIERAKFNTGTFYGNGTFYGTFYVSVFHVFAVLILALIVLSPELFAGTVTNMQINTASLKKYQKTEVTILLDENYTNNYMPEVVSVDALIIKNSVTNVFPCFYYIPVSFYSNATYGGATEDPAHAAWKLRYAFTQDGSYAIRIRVRDSDATNISAPLAVNVSGVEGKGFVRVDASDKRFFRFDNGTPYYPAGFNVAWSSTASGGQHLTDYYGYYLDRMGAAKATWFRYWMAGFARQDLEYRVDLWVPWNTGYGLGRYNQKAAGLLDYVVDLANQKGICLNLVLENHGKWSTTVDPNWTDNPYNTARGGFLNTPSLFFNDATAIRMTKARYRTIVARWAYSPAVMAWELFNEANNTDGASADIVAWHETMAAYIHSLDHAGHIVTTSASAKPFLLSLDTQASSLDQLHYHLYSDNLAQTLSGSIASLMTQVSKPLMAGEYGLSGFNPDTHPDQWGDHVRNSAWLGIFRKVYNMYWYWTFIQKWDLFGLYQPVADFLLNEDLEGLTTFQPVFVNGPQSGTLRFTGALNWVKSTQQEFFIDSYGIAAGLENLSTYLQGTWQIGGLDSTWVTFHAKFTQGGSAFIEVSQVSGAGTKIIDIYTNGRLAGTTNFTAPGTYRVAVPAGSNTVKFTNRGQDWVNVSAYGFTGIEAAGLIGLGLKKDDRAYGYLYDNRNGDYIDPASAKTVTNCGLRLTGLVSGTYRVTFIDPKTGSTESETDVPASGGTLTAPMPDFKKDMAFKAGLVITGSVPETNTPSSAAFPRVYAVFPTSFNPQIHGKAKIYFGGEAPQVQVRIFDSTGNVIKKWDNVIGRYYVEWDGKNQDGKEAGSGLYIVMIKGEGISKTIKMVLVR